MSSIVEFFEQVSQKVEAELDRLLPASSDSGPMLSDAMRWSLLAGGKRFRPSVVFAAGLTFGAEDERLVSTAAAVEMLHTYSLIHDDLPSMDDDDLRRGRQTCHKKFGEATAILAGDALQAKAFETLAIDENLDAELRLDLLQNLGRAAARMVAGQQLDLEAEGKQLSIGEVKSIHENKTGALISFSVIAGALIGHAGRDAMNAVENYGREVGLLFQITDDLLDVTASTERLGKTAGKDAGANKATYPSVIGIEGSQELAREVGAAAREALTGINQQTQLLENIVEYLLTRRS